MVNILEFKLELNLQGQIAFYKVKYTNINSTMCYLPINDAVFSDSRHERRTI